MAIRRAKRDAEDRRAIDASSAPKRSLLALLAKWEPIEEGLAPIDDLPPEPADLFPLPPL